VRTHPCKNFIAPLRVPVEHPESFQDSRPPRSTLKLLQHLAEAEIHTDSVSSVPIFRFSSLLARY